MFSQQRAITGRRIRPNRVAMINAQTPNIYNMMALQDARTNQAASQASADRNYLLSEQQAHDQRKDANRAQNLSLLKLGAGAYFQNRGNTAVNEMLDAPDVSNLGSVSSPEMSEFSTGAASEIPSTGSKVWEGGVKGLKSFGNKLSKPSTLLSAGIGGWAGKKYGGDNKWKSAAIGAGAGAASQWVLGGGLKNLITGTGKTDWYSSALSGALGGALSLFS